MTKLLDERGYWYVLPGGGQHPAESISDTLRRECLEEIDTEVVMGDLVYIREYIAEHNEFPWSRADLHQVEMVFACTLPEGAQPTKGSVGDTDQVGVEWLPLSELDSYRVYPLALRSLLAQTYAENRAAYLGVVPSKPEDLEKQAG